jgi:hypothetical protein
LTLDRGVRFVDFRPPAEVESKMLCMRQIVLYTVEHGYGRV